VLGGFGGNYTKNIGFYGIPEGLISSGFSISGVEGTWCHLFLTLYEALYRTKVQETPTSDVSSKRFIYGQQQTNFYFDRPRVGGGCFCLGQIAVGGVHQL